MANVYRLAIRDGAKAEPVTDLTRHVHDALLSPDGKWLAFRRNTEIWIAYMRSGVLKDQDFRRFSNEGGRSFSFTADSSAIVYSEGARVWRRQIEGGRTTEIRVGLTLPRAVAPPLLITHVRVIDVQSCKVGSESSMLVEQGRIRWIGSETGRAIPANAVRIDAGGRYAIPGIMDSHTHTAWSNQQITEDSLIAYGVTSVRDTGSRLDVINALRNRGDSTGLPIPRYFASGDIYEGLMPLWGDAFLEITDKEEARDYVRYWRDMGASFIKVYASLPWFVKSEVAAEANRLGMPIVGHGLSVEEIVRSVNFGITSVEHGPPLNDDIIKLLASSGTRLDPTLTVFGQGTPTKMADAATLDTKFRTFIPEDAVAAGRPGRPVNDQQKTAWLNSIATYKKLQESGVRLLDGTDALMTSVFFGPSVHWELQFYAWAGLTPADVLRMATISAAESVGASTEIGSLEPGKLGDVVLLDANPLDDIANTMKIWRVIKGGYVFDPATMRK
jgi:imidazolonepropionase-like amidohydrolase